MFKDV